ncbi:hypothetical protein AABB24_001697 [Solanum stoloniferum]|uniref:TMS membrane family protein n=1 Tax=Solanum stoloniferum TaxID=62892 RepID=A0ABD2VNP6_9SOLN
MVAHFGAGVFLLIQLISIISFITWLNDFCHSEKYAVRCHVQMMLLATVAYVICILGIILMYIWYTPQPSCLLNIFFISWTLVLLQLMTSVSLHPKVNAGFLTPGFMGLYVVFLCWSAIRSEPAEERCIRKAESPTGKGDWFTIISFVVAVLTIVIATFSTGIDSKCFQFKKDDAPEEDDVPYGYGFFHFVFATGAMYFAMLLIGWNPNHAMKKFTIDVGWTSTWVRVVNEWLAVCVYSKLLSFHIVNYGIIIKILDNVMLLTFLKFTSMDARGSDHMEKQASCNIKCVTDKLHIAKISPNSYGWPLWFSCLSPKTEGKKKVSTI